MKASFPHPQNVVERLMVDVRELEKSPLPTGRDGAAILDVLEAIDRARKRKRIAAKQMLVMSPDALPGWMIALPNGRRSSNPGPRWKEGRMLVQEYRRSTSIKLIRRRSLQKTLKEGKKTTPP
jgi:hypothetical protein